MFWTVLKTAADNGGQLAYWAAHLALLGDTRSAHKERLDHNSIE